MRLGLVSPFLDKALGPCTLLGRQCQNSCPTSSSVSAIFLSASSIYSFSMGPFRFDGLCFHFSCCRALGKNPYWSICPLSYDQYRHGGSSKKQKCGGYQFWEHIAVCFVELVKASVCFTHHAVVVLMPTGYRYYRVFMYYYSRSLANARFLMVNSSWSKNHVDSLLRYNDTLVQALQFVPPFCFFFLSTRPHGDHPTQSQIVYPPCDTREMAKFSLNDRERVILSVAQFR
jgi:hypothetical protein